MDILFDLGCLFALIAASCLVMIPLAWWADRGER